MTDLDDMEVALMAESNPRAAAIVRAMYATLAKPMRPDDEQIPGRDDLNGEVE